MKYKYKYKYKYKHKYKYKFKHKYKYKYLEGRFVCIAGQMAGQTYQTRGSCCSKLKNLFQMFKLLVASFATEK